LYGSKSDALAEIKGSKLEGWQIKAVRSLIILQKARKNRNMFVE
jgi:uncharacterized protein (UPF0335 family)